MSTYNFTLYVDGVEVTEAVLGGVTVTLGRTDLDTRIAQNTISFQVSRTILEAILVTASGPPPDLLLNIGREIAYFQADIGTLLFRGKITDLSSDATTVSVTAVDSWTFQAVANPPVTYGNLTNTVAGHLVTISGFSGLPIQIPVGYTGPTTYFEAIYSATNLIQPIQNLLGNTETAWLIYNPSLTGLVLAFRTNNPGGIAHTLQSAQVKRSYGIQKSVADITNRVTVTDANDVAQTFSNQTSVNEIGPRVETLDTGLTNATEAGARALFELGVKSPANWSLLEIQTDASLVGGVTAALALRPNAKLDCSNVDAFGFAPVMYVEQTTWTCSKSSWQISLLLSNGAHSGPQQTWADALNFPVNPPTPQWAQANPSYTWDTMLYTDI